jgi:hypothetical protein
VEDLRDVAFKTLKPKYEEFLKTDFGKEFAGKLSIFFCNT